MIENADGPSVAARADLAKDLHILRADTERENLASLRVAGDVHAVEVETEQVGFHQLDRRGETVEVAVAMVKVVDDANMVRPVVLLQIFADGDEILRLTAPAAVIVESEWATCLAGALDDRQQPRRGGFDPFLRRGFVAATEGEPDLRTEVILFKEAEGFFVRAPEGKELNAVFLIGKDLALELRDMLLPPVVGDLLDAHLRDHLGAFLGRSLLRVEGHDAPGREVRFFEEIRGFGRAAHGKRGNHGKDCRSLSPDRTKGRKGGHRESKFFAHHIP